MFTHTGRTGVAAVALATALVGMALLHGSAEPEEAAELQLAPANDYLLDAFERFPLVAFSEPGHGDGGTREFLQSLLRDPRFSEAVDDIVVEFGNARYQAVADRYVAGERVAQDELKQIWENTTIVTGVWSAPAYRGFLEDVRASNTTLPPDRRLRVLLGDPPIDWTQVRGPADEDMNDWRDAHFAWVVEEQVIKKKRRALLWIGGAHITRQVMLPETLIHLLDRRFPGQTLVVAALDHENVDEQVLRRLGSWPSLMAAPVRTTWLGRVHARSGAGMGLSTGSIEQNIDVAIFWEYPARLPDEGPAFDDNSPFGLELRRREELGHRTIAFRGAAIRFEAGTARIMTRSEPALSAVLAELHRDSELKLLVKAFTDERERDGPALSLERARAVVNWLVERGVATERLEPRGCASSRALWIGLTEEQRAANRRAELVRLSPWADCVPPASFDAPRTVEPASLDDSAASRSGASR
jgi:outer membrane protein OmpA-like peptidoglycan-associated protein